KSSEWAISFPVDERMATKRIGIVGYNGVTALDIVGPLEAFATASYGSPERVGRRAYEVMIIGLIDAPFTAESGLLDHRRVTTHWRFARDVAQRYPKLQLDDNAMFLQDGKFHTSAGITAGIDLSLAL